MRRLRDSSPPQSGRANGDGPGLERMLLGIVTLGLLLGGSGLMLFSDSPSQRLGGAVAVRAGAVLGAVWLALPDVRRLSRRGALVGAILVGVVLLRPLAILLVIPWRRC